jgi:hypothetical protein
MNKQDYNRFVNDAKNAVFEFKDYIRNNSLYDDESTSVNVNGNIYQALYNGPDGTFEVDIDDLQKCVSVQCTFASAQYSLLAKNQMIQAEGTRPVFLEHWYVFDKVFSQVL